MPKVDDELTRRLRRAERPVDVDDVFEGLEGRRSHRERVRRVRAGLLALAVVAATAGTFTALSRAFREPPGTGNSPLPSNGLIVFSDRAPDGHEHLFGISPDGRGLRRITNFATDDTNPAVSPDGRTVVFLHELEDLRPVVASMPLEGGPLTVLTEPDLFVTDGPAWSPDGTRIVFAAHDGQLQRIYVMEGDGSRPRPITGDETPWAEDPAWSPDGTKVAFSASLTAGDEGPTTWDIFTVGPNGDGLLNITETPDVGSDEFGPTWSPDGTRVSFSRTHGDGATIVVHPLGGGSERVLTNGSSIDVAPAWSPDGQEIVFERAAVSGGRSDLWLIRSIGTEPVRLTSQGGFAPAWQPLPTGDLQPEPTVEPTPQPPGHDIGLGFPLCNIERLGGIDWYGDGIRGAAWTGARIAGDGRCPSEGAGEYVVGADLDGDGVAEPGGMGFVDHCLLCRPVAATDLNGDGVLELVVLEEASSTPSYSLYEVSVPTSERSPGIYSLFVAPPGYPAGGFPGGEPIRFLAGGDEGFSAAIACEGYPDAPILVVAWSDYKVDVDVTEDVYVTRLRLGDDGAFHVVASEHSTQDVGDPLPIDPGGKACGVDFNPWA